MSIVRIGLITTLNRNIGDDFIREGIVQVLAKIFAGRSLRFIAVDKHAPFTVYPGWHPLRWLQGLDRIPRGRRAAEKTKAATSQALFRLGGSRFDATQLIVQCGAPVMWPGCHRCEWATPLWDQVAGRLSRGIPVLNLAAGSAYPWENLPTVVSDAQDAAFLNRILGFCQITTARDELFSHLASGLGASVPTIPCSAFLAGRRFQFDHVDDDGIVLFNYMPGGGHFDWGQGIDRERWAATAKLLIQRLSVRHRVAFLCHDLQEYTAAGHLNPELPRLLPTTIDEYFSLIGRAKAAVCNRVHAAVALAGAGIPSISVGTDSRLLMVAAIGLSNYYVKDVSVGQLEADLETALTNRANERDRLIQLREWTWSRYEDEVSKAVAA